MGCESRSTVAAGEEEKQQEKQQEKRQQLPRQSTMEGRRGTRTSTSTRRQRQQQGKGAGMTGGHPSIAESAHPVLVCSDDEAGRGQQEGRTGETRVWEEREGPVRSSSSSRRGDSQ